jgi:hypothetical protein
MMISVLNLNSIEAGMASAANGLFLKLVSNRKQIFEEGVAEDAKFSEPVEDFAHSRNAALICFVFTSGKLTHIAKARKGQSAGTGLRRVNLSDVTSLEVAITGKALLKKIPKKFHKAVSKRLTEGGLLSPKSFEHVVDALRQLSSISAVLLDRFSTSRRDLVRKLSSDVKQSLEHQKVALISALQLADMDRQSLQDWNPPDQGAPISFLDGLESFRSLEDQMIVSDLQKVPGFNFVRAHSAAAAIFESKESRLTVILANKLPLERQTGTDLIYFNETYQSFVMVQYKAMDKDSNSDAFFSLPDQQLSIEIQRMDQVVQQMSTCVVDTSVDGYRLNENPFFLKLCPRLIFNPDEVSAVPGMYFPLDYWKTLVNDKVQTRGPRGGQRITYQNAKRHMDNTEFINCVSKAWVGTNAKQSAHLKSLVLQVMKTGRSVALAVKVKKDRPHN